ncbi:MAG: polysaccharide deacetylase family protein [Chroococcidiopsidaceae cyanobacterium CP_BM_ER_R8_30]|nr:polysaccharide deacetylase family protein [Chroococcidiopsidaceae cyanobacterium CP_BM_ER_R8_30]
MLFRRKRPSDARSEFPNKNLSWLRTTTGANSTGKLSLAIVADLLALILPLVFSSPLVAEPTLAQSFQQPDSSPVLSSDSTSATDQPLTQTCDSGTSSLQLANLVGSWVQAANWVEKPEVGMHRLIQKFGPQLMAYLNPSPWPEINQRARLARVPVIMYHDILPEKEVFFDITPEEFEQQLRLIHDNGLTPISLAELVAHLRTGLPLPDKPILLTFDDGYESAYRYVYPLLKQYGYPAVFSIYTKNIGIDTGREHVTWDQLREMAANPLVTISAHSVTHPHDVTALSDARLRREIVQSKRIIESKLGIPIRYFTYPEGKYDARVEKFVQEAGYVAALTMNDFEDRFAGQSKNLLAIDRIGQSGLQNAIAQAWGGPKLANWSGGFDFNSPIKITRVTIDRNRLMMVSGGRPITIHANSRYQVPQIIAGTNATAAVDGGFFSMRYLNSNEMIGPVLSQNEHKFIPGLKYENTRSVGRPLVLISPRAVKFIPFDQTKHNTLAGIQAEMPNVTDAFIAAAWLVKDSQPQPAKNFGNLVDFAVARNRAFWGINQQGQPMIGVTLNLVDAISLGKSLAKAGFRDAVMVDSGASSSLAYKGKSLMANLVGYELRPVPHVVALIAPPSASNTCVAAAAKLP